ncbi:AAA family ATPase [Streptomyces sp. NPDC090080]|uniref:helix-turn-helix transcriptional regulator n=1 Tax=Streptomyces sp. NPDC090080 TaxID=3365939 RepID=UPI00380000BD
MEPGVVSVHASPLRGRSEPMTRALSAVRRARQLGLASAILVSGQSGIGKSALLHEACRQASMMKVHVASSKCDQIEQVWPGAPVIQMLRAGRMPLASAEEYEELTRSVHEPLLLVDRVATIMESSAASAPMMICIDDFQWADRVSRFAVSALISRLAGLPIVWLIASRSDTLGRELTGLDGTYFEHVKLTPLSLDDLAAIAEDRLGVAADERMRQFLLTADGNPFLATQVIDSIVRSSERGEPESLPTEFTATVATRLAELSEPARTVVELTAVAGRALPMRDVTALSPQSQSREHQAAVTDAVKSGLITAHDQSLVTRHDLVREAVYATLPSREARRLHRQFAQHYLDTADEPFLAASHAREAATPGDLESAGILVTAAETLIEVSVSDAADLALLAQTTVRPSQREWLPISLRSLSVLCKAQRTTEAITVANTVLARTDDANLIGQVETEAARALWLGGQVRDLVHRTDRLLHVSELKPSITARLSSARALAGTRQLPGGDAAVAAAAALDQARAAEDHEAITLALQAVGEAAKNEGRHQTALEHFRELRLLNKASYLAEEITALQFLDRYEHAQLLLDQAKEDSRNATAAVVPAIQCAQLWQDFNLGRLTDAENVARSLIVLGRQLGNNVHTLDAVVIQVAVSLLRGDAAAASNCLQQAEHFVDADMDLRRPGLSVMRGWVEAVSGNLQSSLNTLKPIVEGAGADHSYWPLWPCWNGLFFEVGTMAFDSGFQVTCVEIAEMAASRNPGVASFAGVALNLRGRLDDDLDVVAQSVEVLKESPRPLLRAVGADSLGRLLLARGLRADGLNYLDQAWDDYNAMGAVAYQTDVQREMRKAGARRAKWTASQRKSASVWEPLTDAEQRVAVLISEGHSNKEAAAALSVSVNTVGTHLRSIFRKLGIQSRVQLANMFNGRDAASSSVLTEV